MQTYRSIAPMALGARQPESPSYVAARAQRRHRTSTACNECRKQKSKCSIRDGETQCDRCLQSQLECIVEVADDLRRKMAQKRRIRELEEDRRILLYLVEALVGALGESSDGHVRELVCLIRKKAPLEEIRLFVGQACSSSEKSDEDTGTDTSVVVGKALASTASIDDAGNDTDQEFSTGLPPCSERTNSCDRLNIAYLINSTASTDDTGTSTRSMPDLTITPDPDPAGLVFRDIQRCESKVTESSVS
ncbi:hypothetical protein BJX66DRAFT_291197 [Aspergillus keveii]|uniref:Zn(2)-C6 fungal-type domain-containing protein n=1 Tax=Aspergillus keveii TaxID=714993 RepID=A0ABR4GNJ4_9EURO